MPYAINLFFDTPFENTIQALWQEMAEIESATYLHESGARPHIKLAVYQTLELSAVEQALQVVATTTETMPIVFKQIGVFPNSEPTVFLAPAVTVPLLDLQRRVCQALQPVTTDFSTEYFSTGQWVPHCLIALAVESAHLAAVLEVGMQLTLPCVVQLQSLGVVEFRPSRLLSEFPLKRRPEA